MLRVRHVLLPPSWSLPSLRESLLPRSCIGGEIRRWPPQCAIHFCIHDPLPFITNHSAILPASARTVHPEQWTLYPRRSSAVAVHTCLMPICPAGRPRPPPTGSATQSVPGGPNPRKSMPLAPTLAVGSVGATDGVAAPVGVAAEAGAATDATLAGAATAAVVAGATAAAGTAAGNSMTLPMKSMVDTA